MRVILDQLHVIAVGASELRTASMESGDFEDRLQSVCAAVAGMDFIITRDRAGFAGGKVQAIEPATFLSRIVSAG